MKNLTAPISHSSRKSKADTKAKPCNPIETAIKSWIEGLPEELSELVLHNAHEIITRAPKRWVVYFPLVLLPSGSFNEQWWSVFKTTNVQTSQTTELWANILQEIGKREGKGTLTHLAVNSGIPLNSTVFPDTIDNSMGNILRTPSGLIMLSGDFGPILDPKSSPSGKDFDEAFWVSTKQNGITQIWAPRYTMFSRGNIKEKTRLLNFYSPGKRGARENGANLHTQAAVDLYAGIGYFVFSYAKLGFGRVIGWELNPWSVEGLRRGALANGWTMKVVQSGEALELGDEKVTIVLEDNALASKMLNAPRLPNISHVNCGLLPTSQASWQTAIEALNSDGWLHLHENVGVKDIEYRREEIEQLLQTALTKNNDIRVVKVEHVELVKTFAPDVWHCVFDVYIYKP